MGIDKLFDFLRRFNDLEVPYFVDSFKGHRIAIDGHAYGYRVFNGAHSGVVNRTNVFEMDVDRSDVRREWYRLTLKFIQFWADEGVTPVFVFDGGAPPEKTKTKAKRISDVQKAEQAFLDLKAEKIPPNPQRLKRARTLICESSSISKAELAHYIDFISGMGLPCFSSTTEAEKMCSMLAIEGKVVGVYSTDSDTLTHGCPLLLTSNRCEPYYTKDGIKHSTVIGFELSNVLKEIKMDYKSFLDLCIMAKCDYNREEAKTSGNRLGIQTSYKYLQQYGNYETIIIYLRNKYNFEVLNRQRCLELFSITPSIDLMPIDQKELILDFDREVFQKCSTSLLESVGLGFFRDSLEETFQSLSQSKDLGYVRIPR